MQVEEPTYQIQWRGVLPDYVSVEEDEDGSRWVTIDRAVYVQFEADAGYVNNGVNPLNLGFRVNRDNETQYAGRVLLPGRKEFEPPQIP